ncbi:hypothetical protein BJ138DRAFT_1019726, partial [Hygrophoropsis aurantiaca]
IISCFPHIVNLACKAVLSAITNINFAKDNAANFVPGGPPPDDFLAAVNRDPIATVRTVGRVIRASSIRRQYFSAILSALKQKDLQLLRDVDVRWSSTLLMIECAILLCAVCAVAFAAPLTNKYQLNSAEWNALEIFKKILAATYQLTENNLILLLQVPHAFQQKLSAEKTPTLCHAIPAFEAMKRVWTAQKDANYNTTDIIKSSLNKLSFYKHRTTIVPAYTLAMSTSSFLLNSRIVINPTMKLMWFSRFAPHQVQWAKDLFLHEVCNLWLSQNQI